MTATNVCRRVGRNNVLISRPLGRLRTTPGASLHTATLVSFSRSFSSASRKLPHSAIATHGAQLRLGIPRLPLLRLHGSPSARADTPWGRPSASWPVRAVRFSCCRWPSGQRRRAMPRAGRASWLRSRWGGGMRELGRFPKIGDSQGRAARGSRVTPSIHVNGRVLAWPARRALSRRPPGCRVRRRASRVICPITDSFVAPPRCARRMCSASGRQGQTDARAPSTKGSSTCGPRRTTSFQHVPGFSCCHSAATQRHGGLVRILGGPGTERLSTA